MRGLSLGITLLLVCVSPSHAQLHHARYEPHTVNDVTMLPAGWPKIEEFQRALQSFINTTYKRGFREVGDKFDFFHGHLLYAEDSAVDKYGAMLPVAILYHTQEDAFDFHQKDPGGPYDYLDSRRRNWLQFFDSATNSPAIFNAYNFMYTFFPDLPGARSDLDSSRERYTVHASAIDDSLFPESHQHRIVGQRQLSFFAVNCSDHVGLYPQLYYRPVIEVEVPEALAPTCLELQSESNYAPQPWYSPFGRTLYNDTIPQLPNEDLVAYER